MRLLAGLNVTMNWEAVAFIHYLMFPKNILMVSNFDNIAYV